MDALFDARPRVIALGGPTATGKTALSLYLAAKFQGEILSADSMQLYRQLDIGTAKATPAERAAVPHHLLDILPPDTPFSVADYTALAGQTIAEITARGALPFVVGGTGLYITSLLSGVRFTPEKGDTALRATLEERAAAGQGPQLYAELMQIDPAYAETVPPHNLPRVIRALELYGSTGQTMSEQRRQSIPPQPPYRALCLCLACRDRQRLYDRIDARVDKMMVEGLLQEAEWVWQNRRQFRTAAQAIGYKELFPYFAGEKPLEDCVQTLKQASRNYAKRQLTWFRHQGDAVWLDADAPGLNQQAEQLVQEFINR
ncbi:MAG: tRNA (adenosine(37)-N6)-dimethylallyltransferase MiaA [Gemmiger sp.]|nr:tRNA (adenosine(37)-N6)-dimethylallyltransferase MiaA [Gemmiger sp.]